MLTFFCSLTTLVHFFSMTPSYCFRFASLKSSGKSTSSWKASSALEAPIAPRYAAMALFLHNFCQCPLRLPDMCAHSQLDGLSICQNGVHGGAIGTEAGSPRAATIYYRSK